MPITRTPIVDDDGTGTTGTVLDNAWKQELYGQIDGALGKIAAPYVISNYLRYTLTAPSYPSLNPPGGAGAVTWIIDATGAASAVMGMPTEAPWTLHLIVNVGGYPITFKSQNAGAAAGSYQFLCPGYADYVLGPVRSVWVYQLQDPFPLWVPLVS